ncbi:hypothetical protein HUJ04_013248 [Dendroctonus ponderosae]
MDSPDTKTLTSLEREHLKAQDSRLVSAHKAEQLERQAQKHWDLFYKRNETRFFRDRHWTTREFAELVGEHNGAQKRVLFEVGCGVGNFIYPLIEEQLNLHILACDLSPRAIELLKNNPLYDAGRIRAFHCDISSEQFVDHVESSSVDVATLIFVLSAIHPDKFAVTLQNIHKLLKPGGLLMFRDYGLYDMAQLRFKPGNKIADNFYMRQDGTRTYFFSTQCVQELLERAGFKVLSNEYIHRRTINRKEDVDVPRIFVQLKAQKIA